MAGTVAVHVVLEFVLAVLELRYGDLGFFLAILQPLDAEFFIGVQADLIDELDQLVISVLVGQYLSVQIAVAFILHLEVQHDQVHYVLDQLAPVIKLYHGDPESFVIDRRSSSGSIGVVTGVYHEGYKLALVEYRLQNDDIGKVGAASGVGVVCDENISLMDLAFVILFCQDLHRSRKRTEVERNVLGQSQQLSLWAEYGHRQVFSFLDVGAVARLCKDDAHLLCDGGHTIGNDLKCDGIYLTHYHHLLSVFSR